MVPPPPPNLKIAPRSLVMLAIGFVGQGNVVGAIRFYILKHLAESCSTLCCSVVFILRFLCSLLPTPLCFHAFVVTLSVMLAVGFVGQGKVVCAIRF